jgi:alpha-galactosidase
MRIGEKTYSSGIGVNAESKLRVELTKPAARLRAVIGVDQNNDSMNSSVRFVVETGGKKIFASEFMRSSAGARNIDIPLDGAQTFDLIVDAGPDNRGPGQADWADATVLLGDGSQVQLDELADRWNVASDLPFSFSLGGQSSRAFLPQWKQDVHTEQLDGNRLQRTVTLQDPKTGLELKVVVTIYTDTPGVDWTLYLSNHGTKDTPVIEDLNALDVTLNPGVGTAPVLYRLRGSLAQANDWQPYEDSLKPGREIEFAPTNGKSSEGVSPYFTLQYGGGGVITAVGWSGGWRAATEWQKDGKLRLQAGLQSLHLRLHPGESIRSPRILQLYWFGNNTPRAYNLFRETMLSHIVPRVDGAIVVPPIAHLSTSFYETNESTEKSVLSHLESIRGLGFEVFWLDAYWTKGGFPQGMGNYGFPIERVEPSDRFPNGLKPISDAAHRDGMKFLVWFEPERVYRGTHLAKEHPEWVITLDNAESGLYNLGVPEAREYMTKYLIAAIQAYGIDCLRIDFNIDPAPYWRQLDAKDPDRAGLAQIRYIEGLYRMWDDIHKAFPRLFIDDCASGGRRIDLETSSRSISLWRTDGTIEPLIEEDFNQAALQNQVMTAGLSRYVPFSTSGEMGATPYLFRSGFNAGISFGEDVRSSTYPRDQLKQGIEEGKRIRKYFFGNFYPLNEVTTSPEDWCVLQYHRSAEQDGMLLVFRRQLSPYDSYNSVLHEIEPKAQYDVTFYPTYSAAKSATMAGAELQHLKLEIPDSPGSLLIEYKKIHP